MIDRTVKIVGPIKTQDSSRERVAYDLMANIAYWEDKNPPSPKTSRSYWLELYSQCYNATQDASTS